jgi:hypothetical protein
VSFGAIFCGKLLHSAAQPESDESTTEEGTGYSHGTRRIYASFSGGLSGPRPSGSGKTALVDRLSQRLWPKYNLAVVTNDIYTKEDAQFLLRQGVLPAERVRGVETGACPHSAIREDASMNLQAIAELEDSLAGLQLIFVESEGDNLAAGVQSGAGGCVDLCDRCDRRRQDTAQAWAGNHAL